jgi:hypothetical protein
MFRYPAALFLLISTCFSAYSQAVSGFIIDKVTREAVPYATIQLGPETGTIANEEGGFSMVLPSQAQDSLLISSMGYEQKRISFPVDSREIIIYLNPSTIELDEVLLRNRQPTAEEIIREVRAAYPINYVWSDQKYQIFFRGTSYLELDDLSASIEKASGISKQQVNRASKSLDSLGKAIVESRLMEFRDYSGKVLIKDKDSLKVDIDRATKLIDSKKDFSMDGVQRKARNIVLQYLDTTMTYKLKTGLFKIEDSLAFDREDFVQDNKTEFSKEEIRSSVLQTFRVSQWHENSFLDKILQLDAYRFTLVGASYFQGTPIYVLSFSPRRGSSKYAGRVYVSAHDFAVLKADYAYDQGKRGRKFNMKLLLGIKYIEKTNRGTIIYKAKENGRYRPYYITRETGNYIYLHRPFKFIENSRKKDKVLFDFSLEGEGREKQELLILGDSPLEIGEYSRFTESDKVPYTLLKQFEPSIWEDRQIIQPLEEMKNFRVVK